MHSHLSFHTLPFLYCQVKGKIVVYNEKWVDYGTSVIYRDRGASEAAELGAVASLIRSVTPFSIYSPHTGWQDYQGGNVDFGKTSSVFLVTCMSVCAKFLETLMRSCKRILFCTAQVFYVKWLNPFVSKPPVVTHADPFPFLPLVMSPVLTARTTLSSDICRGKRSSFQTMPE